MSRPTPSPRRSTAPLQARFVQSAAQLEGCPFEDLPEVAFAGRSNAGKSSALNCLTGTRDLARVSRTPGRTQLLNFFAVPGGHLVDLPGYGYAQVDRRTRERWSVFMASYLQGRRQLRGLIIVMDARHPFRDTDQALLGWASGAQLAAHVLLNKWDKLNQSERAQAIRAAEQALRDTPTSWQPFSALRGTGTDQATARIRDWLQPPAQTASAEDPSTPVP